MASWLNHVTIAAPRNGTNTHAVSPSSGTAVAGSLFTPAAGNLLLCVVEGAVTSTTPGGWTLPNGGSAVNFSGLYLWWRTAAGGDSFTTTHNAANYPAVFDFYEFPAGSTFVGAVSATGVSQSGGAGPTLTGLTGTNWVGASVGVANPSTDSPTVTWSNGVEAVDTAVPRSGTDGYIYSLTYREDYTGSSSSSSSSNAQQATASAERLVFAVRVVAPVAPSTIEPAPVTTATVTTRPDVSAPPIPATQIAPTDLAATVQVSRPDVTAPLLPVPTVKPNGVTATVAASRPDVTAPDDFILGVTRPTAANTGPRAGVTLTQQTGNRYCDTAGEVIEGLDLHGNLIVRAAGVTLRDSIIRGDSNTASGDSITLYSANASNFTAEFCDIYRATPNEHATGVIGHGYTLRRCHIYACVDGTGVFDTANPNGDMAVTIEGCLIDGLAYFSPCSYQSNNQTHNDCLQIQGGSNITILGCDLSGYIDPAIGLGVADRPFAPSLAYMSAIIITPNVGAVADVTIDRNWLGGGTSTVNISDEKGLGPIQGLTITGNRFDGGQQGIALYITPTTEAVATISGNTYPDGTPVVPNEAKPATAEATYLGTVASKADNSDFTVTLSEDVAVGTTLLATFASQGGSGPWSAIDPAGNTWHADGDASGANVCVGLMSCTLTQPLSAGQKITATPPAGVTVAHFAAVVDAYAGITAGATATQVQPQGTGGGSTPISMPPIDADGLAYVGACYAPNAAACTLTPGAGWTLGGAAGPVASWGRAALTEYAITTGTITPAGTLDPDGHPLTAVAASYATVQQAPTLLAPVDVQLSTTLTRPDITAPVLPVPAIEPTDVTTGTAVSSPEITTRPRLAPSSVTATVTGTRPDVTAPVLPVPSVEPAPVTTATASSSPQVTTTPTLNPGDLTTTTVATRPDITAPTVGSVTVRPEPLTTATTTTRPAVTRTPRLAPVDLAVLVAASNPAITAPALEVPTLTPAPLALTVTASRPRIGAQAARRDITVTASPVTTGWAAAAVTPNPTTAGPVAPSDWTGQPVTTGWTAGPISTQ